MFFAAQIFKVGNEGKMKILTVFTGGTIGSEITNSIINVKNAERFELIDLFLRKYRQYDGIDFIAEKPANFLSENLTFSKINNIINYLYSVDLSAYDGIIVTHGSDTLSYTAAFLGLAFSHTKIPVVLVASDYPPALKNSNALINLKNAVDFILNAGISGVFVSYSNNGNNAIYLATRIKEADPYEDKFTSFSHTSFGYMQTGEFIRAESKDNPTVNALSSRIKEKLLTDFKLQKSVLLIRQYPNIDFSAFCLSDNTAAVLLYLYHSATACTNGENTSALAFVKRCKEYNIPVYGASFKNSDNMYISSYNIVKAGLIPLVNISLEAAYAKLCIAYNQSRFKPQEIMQKNIYFEHI